MDSNQLTQSKAPCQIGPSRRHGANQVCGPLAALLPSHLFPATGSCRESRQSISAPPADIVNGHLFSHCLAEQQGEAQAGKLKEALRFSTRNPVLVARIKLGLCSRQPAFRLFPRSPAESRAAVKLGEFSRPISKCRFHNSVSIRCVSVRAVKSIPTTFRVPIFRCCPPARPMRTDGTPVSVSRDHRRAGKRPILHPLPPCLSPTGLLACSTTKRKAKQQNYRNAKITETQK